MDMTPEEQRRVDQIKERLKNPYGVIGWYSDVQWLLFLVRKYLQ